LRNKDEIIIAYCSAGTRSKKALKILRKMGYKNLYTVEGGIDIYE
jgi:rhodanese-related sulfurtransferase